jgi:hypothetical protein
MRWGSTRALRCLMRYASGSGSLAQRRDVITVSVALAQCCETPAGYDVSDLSGGLRWSGDPHRSLNEGVALSDDEIRERPGSR